MQSPWAASRPWEGTRGGSSILLFLTPCPGKGYLPKNHCREPKKLGGSMMTQGTRDKQVASEKGWHLWGLACL